MSWVSETEKNGGDGGAVGGDACGDVGVGDDGVPALLLRTVVGREEAAGRRQQDGVVHRRQEAVLARYVLGGTPIICT